MDFNRVIWWWSEVKWFFMELRADLSPVSEEFETIEELMESLEG